MPVCPFDDFLKNDWLADEQKEQFRKNYLLHREMVHPCPKTTEGKDKALILIGASAGLRKQVEQLKDVGPDAIRITTPTNLKFLLENGVRPEYVFALEGRDHWVDDFDCDTRDLILVATPYVSDKALKRWKGKILWYMLPGADSYNQEFKEDWPDTEYEITGGNAISGALCWAMKFLGVRTIAFVGVGLSFGDEYYFDGHSKCDENPSEQEIPYRALDIYGRVVNSTPALTMYKVWFEAFAQIQTTMDTESKFFNCSEEGILGVLPEPIETDGVIKFVPKYIPWMSIVPLNLFLKAWKEMKDASWI